jgi:hypothetical protein
MRALPTRLAIVALLALFAACGSGLSVTGIQLGRSINADGTVANHTTVFKPDDSVYVSVGTSGVGSATLSVKWMYRGHLLGEPTKKVSYRDEATTEFHLQSATGFPVGEYTVEVFLNGQSVGTRTFRVESH